MDLRIVGRFRGRCRRREARVLRVRASVFLLRFPPPSMMLRRLRPGGFLGDFLGDSRGSVGFD